MSMWAKVDEFVAEMQRSLHENTFVKLVLSNYKGDDGHLQKIFVRVVETKKGQQVAFQARHATRDEVKNFDPGSAPERVALYLRAGFRSAHLFTIKNDFQLTVGKRNARLLKTKPTFNNKPNKSHDREKNRFIDPDAYYLKALGITTDDGRIRANQQDKWKQINKFVEIIAGLIEHSSLKDKAGLRIVDMGSGKGYLTFALYDHLVRTGSGSDGIFHNEDGAGIAFIGVEQRDELVALCNDIVRSTGFDGLKFVTGTIVDTVLQNVDILIALHACDTATDDAIYKGITGGASIIVAAPCCHHEVKQQLKPPGLLAGILKHPVFLERTAETVTDGIRSLLLEASGYRTKMFEFVATEHTPKNNMLVAAKTNRRKADEQKLEEVRTLMDEFKIDHQKLFDLLKKHEDQTNEG